MPKAGFDKKKHNPPGRVMLCNQLIFIVSYSFQGSGYSVSHPQLIPFSVAGTPDLSH